MDQDVMMLLPYRLRTETRNIQALAFSSIFELISMNKNQTSDEFSTLTTDETLNRLKSNPVTGLTHTEVKLRIERYGPNAVEEKQQSLVIAFLKRFWGLTAWMLEIAIVISFIFR